MIFNNNQIYAKVWKVTPAENGKYIDLQISTSEKDTSSNTYKYSNWFPRAIGHAANSLKGVKEGDKIIITKSKFTNEKYVKDGVTKSSFQFLILEATVSDGTDVKPTASAPTIVQETVAQDDGVDEPW